MIQFRRKSSQRKAAGFTLIELMVVVAIVALVSAAVVPSFALALQRERQRTTANYIVQAVFAARSRAVRTGRCHQVSVELDSPGVSSGTGGLVRVREYLRSATCATAFADDDATDWANPGVNNWNVVFSRQVSTLVGRDVAISSAQVVGGPLLGVGEVAFFLFESTGEIYVNDALVRVFSILSYDAAPAQIGPRLNVRVNSGGSVGVRFIATSETIY